MKATPTKEQIEAAEAFYRESLTSSANSINGTAPALYASSTGKIYGLRFAHVVPEERRWAGMPADGVARTVVQIQTSPRVRWYGPLKQAGKMTLIKTID